MLGPYASRPSFDNPAHSDNMLLMTKSRARPSSKPRRAPDKMRVYRAKLRGRGLRPVQLWAPDTKAPGFAEAMRRQSLLVSQSPGEEQDIAFVEGLLADNLDLPEA